MRSKILSAAILLFALSVTFGCGDGQAKKPEIPKSFNPVPTQGPVKGGIGNKSDVAPKVEVANPSK